jgi:hypothetical protein
LAGSHATPVPGGRMRPVRLLARHLGKKDPYMLQILNRTIVTSMIAAAAACSATFAQSDDCASPTPISGNVVVPFDLTIATPSGQGNVGLCLNGGTGGFLGRDVWFCWTAECTGMVRISTCGLTQGNTVVAIYPESAFCACPGDGVPLCCNDDACGKQSEVFCEVVCGRRYLIQVGAGPNDIGFPGQVSISCQGEPCGGNGGGLTAPQCGDCCGTRPPLVDNLSTPFAPGQVAAVTFGREDSPAGNIGVLRLVDIGDQSSAPLVGSGSLWSPQEYAHPSWDLATLGSIFGVAFDGQGNIYVAHSVAYSNDLVGSLGVSGAGDGRGAIYRIDGATGVPSLFRTLPQAAGAGAAVGLGNLDFDCGRDCLFATNFEDGRIYSINATTGAISAFDHQTGAVEAESATGNGAAIAEGPNPGGTSSEPAGFAGYGNVPYAVKVAGDRVYYSVWQSYGSAQTVHSVQIDANGLFVTGTGRLELSIPYAPGHPYGNVNCPIADIGFDANCCMLIAERSMATESSPSAHNSRAWRACFDDASASWNAVRYDVGSQGFQTDWQNSSGGIDYVDGSNGEQAWLTGDFFAQGSAGSYYGISGIPLVESNGAQLDTFAGPGINMTSIKTAQGSLDITCPVTETPCEFATEDIDCVPTADGGMDFLWTVTVTNGANSPAANLLILGDPVFAPNNVMVLNPPLGPGQSTTLDIPISGANPGDTFCFTATLAASFKDECCTEEICITLPECRCFDYDADVNAIAGSTGFTVNLAMVNITQPAFPGEWVTVAVASGYAATVSPSLINIPTTPYGASVSTGAITVSTALPAGSLIKLIVGLHSQSFHPCCFVEVDVFVPAQGGSSTPGDVNGDGKVDAADLALLLSGWGLSGASDLDGDGITGPADLAILLSNWG